MEALLKHAHSKQVSNPQGLDIKLKDLDTHCKESAKNNKYQLVFDETGNAHVYFSHKNYLVDLTKLFQALQNNRLKHSHVIDQIRRAMITCMKTGNKLVFTMNHLIALRFMEEI